MYPLSHLKLGQIFLPSILKRTTSQIIHILYGTLDGVQQNFSGKHFFFA